MKYGNLTFIKELGRDKSYHMMWECVCDCGKTITVRRTNLTTGHTISCGCSKTKRLQIHGEAGKGKRGYRRTKEYNTWINIRRRCNCPDTKNYRYYGARGINVYPQWGKSFAAFLADVGRAPTNEHSLDRINSNGNYEPGNVRWSTITEQNNNRHCRGGLYCEASLATHATGIVFFLLELCKL